MKTNNNLLLKIIKNCFISEKIRKSTASLKSNSKQQKLQHTIISFPNCNTILYVQVLSFQKYKNIDLQLDFSIV